MKLRYIFTLLAMSACVAYSGAEQKTPASKGISAHQAAHRQMLANAKMGMDKEVIKDFIKFDVDRREKESLDVKSLSAESSMMVKDLLVEARKHLGKRYRSGAKGPSAFDCSGFAGYVYRQFGYELGASSRDQYLKGEAVKRNELREGDLVFFTGRNSRSGIVGHVGIVVSADNEKGTFKFIHASTSGGVRIDSNNEPYYSRRYIGAKRMITE